MTPEQHNASLVAVLRRVDVMLRIATECGVLDTLAAHMHPDQINQTCDAVTEAIGVEDDASRTADRIDGYDRDDLGESPDY